MNIKTEECSEKKFDREYDKQQKELQQDEHISSLLIQCRPKAVTELRQLLHNPPQYEVTHYDSCGKIVLVHTCYEKLEITRFIEEVTFLSGVYSVNLVYHHVEPSYLLEQTVENI